MDHGRADDGPPRQRRTGRGRTGAVVAAVLIIGGGILIALAIRPQQHAPQPSPAAAGTIAPASTPGHVSTPGSNASGSNALGSKGRSLPRSEPVAIDIPAIGVNSRLLYVGLNPNGTIQVPPLFGHPSEAAWYKYSVTPGQVGASVIEGHVDTYQGPSVFFLLGDLRPGDTADISLADGTVAVFRITAVRQYLKTDFPTELVYGPEDYAALRLITCGGAFDESTRQYLSSTIVFASLVSSHTVPAQPST
jgi:sortase family protein